jgi:hypothetical protein
MAEENQAAQDALDLARAMREAATDPVLQDSIDQTIAQLEAKLNN